MAVRCAIRRVLRVGARRALPALMVSCCVGMLAAPSAQAGLPRVDLVCVASAEFDFFPPLNFNTSEARGLGLASSCTSPSGRYPRLKSAVIFGTTPLVATGCSPAPMTIVGDGSSALWSDGSKGKVDLSVSTDPTSGALGVNATIVEGPLTGSKISLAPTIVAQNGLCLLGGVRSLTIGLGVLTITTPTANRRARTKVDRRRARGR
jgi:hypothetical protein